MPMKPFILSLIFLCSAATISPGSETIIFKEFVIKTNLINQVDDETITLRINGESLTAPFTWSVSIDHTKGRLFFIEHDDNWLDAFFSDDGYVLGCNGYIECKQKWYFQDLPKLLRQSITNSQGIRQPIAQYQTDTLKSLSTRFLSENVADPHDRDKVVNEMIGMLVRNHIRFCPPLTPVQMDKCYLYVPSISLFVPYQDD